VKRTDQSVQELEDYTITKARETTHKVKDCVRAAEAIREDATQTLQTLHRQGEQIARSHHLAADIERDLTVVSSLPADIG
jgi:synaptosomal-associated protein 25